MTLCGQSEYGDIYKVTLDADTESVSELKIKYFDTIPVCTSLCVLKTGFLFAASDFGNHTLYQFQVGRCCRMTASHLHNSTLWHNEGCRLLAHLHVNGLGMVLRSGGNW